MARPQLVTRIINQLSLGGIDRVLENMIQHEKEMGFTVYRPGEIDFFYEAHWKPASIISVAGNRVRIILIDAHSPRSGAFRTLLAEIKNREMVPVVVEPHDRLALTLAEWGWRSRSHLKGEYRETVWYPRR